MAKPKSIKDLIPASAAALITATNSEIIRVVGGDTLRSCVLDVLCGGNIRDSTEPLTRRRISALNLALVDLFIEGLGADPGFTGKVPQLALNAIQSRSSKAEKIVARWLLGLTDKGVQNILRDSPDDLTKYAAQYGEVCAAVVSEFERQRGELGGTIRIGKSTTPRQAQFDGLALLYLLNAVGSQTLTTRGSDKSAYGKLFEKLVLGALLSALGFKHVAPPTAADPLQPNGLKNVFWLTAQEEKRESDATLLLGPGKGVRFDLGFIGRGNPEISLDKVSRFERNLSVAGRTWYMATIILVDRIGEGSRIQELAQEMSGHIVQMGGGYWPTKVAEILRDSVGYKMPKGLQSPHSIRDYLDRHTPSTEELLHFVGL